MSTRRGDFFFTSTGVQFWPLDPRPEEILIEDIAHGLSNICRWGGHCHGSGIFSVAQHSILVSDNLPDHLKLQGLMHDATEAYLGDMIRPLKRHMDAYRDAELHLWIVICEKWNLPIDLDKAVKEADERALMTEARDLMHPIAAIHSTNWSATKPFAETITPNWPQYARAQFLQRFNDLR